MSNYIDQNIEWTKPYVENFLTIAKFFMMTSPKMAPKPYNQILVSKISKRRY